MKRNYAILQWLPEFHGGKYALVEDSLTKAEAKAHIAARSYKIWDAGSAVYIRVKMCDG